ncbi:uncharacterized protein LOC129912629 [Episyrphus balteatus]|uniref:uncharacterized protein LOC129912629 n=1 Tax=Episyrphus balteatus TaxID=286459 RepID=UPI0024862470|nr:uncharacterized protein LOC129912629 [Episyrphus balteatus]
MKSDKGNKIVVMDKNEYDRRCWKLITDSGYDEIKRSPLNKMVTAANEVRKEISNVFGEQFKWKLLISNPDVPRLYCLPKVHKPGDSMRPIVALLSAPCTNISRWLVQEMRQYLPCESLSVKNSIEFAEKVKNIELANDEILASFDVSSLFPSIPVPKAIEIFKNNLIKQNIPIEKVNVYVRAAEMCMNTNYFQFRGRFFKINFGTSMGNPLSLLIAETFMADFEMQLKRKGHLPQTWFRYVDDIFTIVKKNKVNDLLSILNSQHNSIKFTYELEENQTINFLDLKLIRNEQNRIDIAIYHKPTSTFRKKSTQPADFSRVSMTFAPDITNGLKTVFHRNKMSLVFSNKFKLKNKLTSVKDKKDNLEKSGVYEIKCKCGRKYYGQTKRSVATRFKDHQNYIKNNDSKKSAIAAHALHEQHLPITLNDVRLLASVADALGNYKNSQSWINKRSAPGSAIVKVAENSSPNLLSAFDPILVEIIIKNDGELIVNIPGCAEPYMKYFDTNPVNVQFFSFTNWDKMPAKWFYDCQFDENCE